MLPQYTKYSAFRRIHAARSASVTSFVDIIQPSAASIRHVNTSCLIKKERMSSILYRRRSCLKLIEEINNKKTKHRGMRKSVSAAGVASSIRLLLSRKWPFNDFRTFHATSVRSSFIEQDEKSGYPRLSDVEDDAKTLWQKARQGWKLFKQELRLWRSEVAEEIQLDPNVILREGEVDVQWRFQGDPSILAKWVVTADSDYGEGNSSASIELSKSGRGIFTGNLDPRVFRDGKVKRTGYCNVTSVKLEKSFGRTTRLPWGPYTHLVMRIRGDGRNYLLILSTPGEWDLLWNDSYQYVLYTRGGPYWQYVRIPFSKFFFVSHGRIQDNQQPVPTCNISTIGITAGDKIPGTFKLEIDYIGVECDLSHGEEHAYEMYKTPHKFHI